MPSYRSHPYTGGQGIYMRLVTKAMRDLGHKVEVVSGQPYPILDEGVKLTKLPSLDLYSYDNPLKAFNLSYGFSIERSGRRQGLKTCYQVGSSAPVLTLTAPGVFDSVYFQSKDCACFSMIEYHYL